jgi:hypothetical protein
MIEQQIGFEYKFEYSALVVAKRQVDGQGQRDTQSQRRVMTIMVQ